MTKQQVLANKRNQEVEQYEPPQSSLMQSWDSQDLESPSAIISSLGPDDTLNALTLTEPLAALVKEFVYITDVIQHIVELETDDGTVPAVRTILVGYQEDAAKPGFAGPVRNFACVSKGVKSYLRNVRTLKTPAPWTPALCFKVVQVPSKQAGPTLTLQIVTNAKQLKAAGE